jgi:hypothetical protein
MRVDKVRKDNQPRGAGSANGLLERSRVGKRGQMIDEARVIAVGLQAVRLNHGIPQVGANEAVAQIVVRIDVEA